MGATLDLTSIDPALKVRYTDEKMKWMGYRNRPTLAMLSKMESFGGRHMVVPIRFGTPQGRSYEFTDAGSNKEASSFEDFVITRAHDYGRASIDNETLEASVGDVNGFIAGLTSEIDGVIETVSRELSKDIFGDGTGNRGQIGSFASEGGGTNNVVVLVDKRDAKNFEKGMYLVAASAKSGSGATLGSVAQLTKVDRVRGRLTFGSVNLTVDLAVDWAANYYLFVRGDFDASSASATGKKLKGFEAWIPATEPGPTDSFFTVNRSVDTRLSGLRYDGSAETIEEAIQGAGALTFIEGGRPDVAIMNPLDFSDLVKGLGSKAVYDMVKASDVAEIGFKSVLVMTPAGEVKCVSDPDCPRGVAWMLQLDTWKLYSLGTAPKILQADGNRFLREANSDSYEVRVGYYAQLACSAPGWNCRITLPAAA